MIDNATIAPLRNAVSDYMRAKLADVQPIRVPPVRPAEPTATHTDGRGIALAYYKGHVGDYVLASHNSVSQWFQVGETKWRDAK